MTTTFSFTVKHYLGLIIIWKSSECFLVANLETSQQTNVGVNQKTEEKEANDVWIYSESAEKADPRQAEEANDSKGANLASQTPQTPPPPNI